MKTYLKTLFLIPFFTFLLFTSCVDEEIDTEVDISALEDVEALVSESYLTSLINATSKRDGSADNIIDKASCLSVEFPITVFANGVEITLDSKEDLKVIETIFKAYDDDDDKIDIVFPITVILSDHEEVFIENRESLEALILTCKGDNEEDDDIECIDFKYPLAFSIFNPNIQVIDVVTIENDRELHHFIKRIRNEVGFLASLNFPVTLKLADGNEIVVNNNDELQRTMEEAKDSCDEDDDNDYGDDDFTKEDLDNYLLTCPWVIHEFQKNEDNIEQYLEYVMVFKDDNIVKVYTHNGNILTGSWITRVTDKGALLKLEFDTLTDFNLEWLVYDLEPGKIKLFQEGGQRIILNKNCDIDVEITKMRIEHVLQECLWRIERLYVDGLQNEGDYIGTPLKFFENNIVKLRINGDAVEGTYEVVETSSGFILQVFLDGRPNLKLEWLITLFESGLIKLSNANNQMILERHCPDEDLNEIDDILISGIWEVTTYEVDEQNNPEAFYQYTIEFIETGRLEVTNPNAVISYGSWLSYRKEGLNLALFFGDEAPFKGLNYRWKLADISPNRIVLKELNPNGVIVRELILVRKN